MFRTDRGSPSPSPSRDPSQPFGAQGASDSPRDRLSTPIEAQRTRILLSLEASQLGAEGHEYFKTGDRVQNEERVRSFMTLLGDKDLGLEYDSKVKREFRRHCLPTPRRQAQAATGDAGQSARGRQGRARRETAPVREPDQSQTRRRSEKKETQPLAPLTPDRADSVDDLRAMFGKFAFKSDAYLQEFLAYLGPRRSKEDITKAFPGFRALHAASRPPARPALPKSPGVHGGAFAKQREAHLQELNKIEDDGLTKLMRAVLSKNGTEEDRAKAVEDLLNDGADPRLSAKWPEDVSDAKLARLQRAADYYGVAPYERKSYGFVQNVLLKVFPSLAEGNVARYAGMNALTMAIAFDASDRIVLALSKALEQRKVRTDPPDASGHTPLTLAVEANDPGGVALLLQQGADIDAPDGHGRTPLMLAARMNNLDLVKMLTERKPGANYLASVPDHVTPLSLAIDGASKDNLAERTDLLNYLLSTIVKLCQNFNAESETGHSDGA